MPSKKLLFYIQGFAVVAIASDNFLHTGDAVKSYLTSCSYQAACEAIKVYEENRFFIIVMFVVLWAISWFLYRQQANSWRKETVKSILDSLKTQFLDLDDGAVDNHRVSLFKWRRTIPLKSIPRLFKSRSKNPVNGWLTLYSRSGHISTRSNVCFAASKKRSELCEGVAGEAWASKKTKTIYQLPEINTNTDKADIRDYADKTNVKEQYVRERASKENGLPRSMFAYHIDLEGRPWGVIVLDSRLPDDLLYHVNTAVFPTVSLMLEKLLERS